MSEHHVRLDFAFAPIPEELLFDTAMSATAVRIWGTLARFGLDPESCFPSHETLGELLDMAPRSVGRPIKELESAGWIERFPRFGPKGRLSDGYRLHATREIARSTSQNCAVPPARNRAVPPAPSSLLEIEPKEREKNAPAQDRAASPPATTGPSFDDFWAIYPRRTGKGGAKTAWQKALKKAPAQTIYDAALRFAEDANLPEAQFIPHPATWLNQERWEDGPQPERNDGRRQTPAERTIQNLTELFEEGGGNGNGTGDRSGTGRSQRGLPSRDR